MAPPSPPSKTTGALGGVTGSSMRFALIDKASGGWLGWASLDAGDVDVSLPLLYVESSVASNLCSFSAASI
jgi:hypothetical protein